MISTTLEKIVNYLKEYPDDQKMLKELEICKECPEYQNCISCDDQPWRWWDHMVENRAPIKIDIGESDGLYIDNNWYDHTDEQFLELLENFNINAKIDKKHGKTCSCLTCRPNVIF